MTTTMPPIVDTAWLAGQLGQPDLVLFDASAYMPAEGKDGKAEYRRAHLPGARFFDVDEVADPDTDLPHMVPSQGRFSRLVGALGVDNACRVVFYDQKGLFSAARGWWLFCLFGHDRVAVLDGGLPKWLAEGRAIEAGEAAAATAKVFHPNFRAELLRGLGDMRRNAESGRELVLDARSRERFDGTAPDPRAWLPSGHMPFSRSLPYGELLNEDKTLKSPAELRRIFAEVGADGSQPLVCSCGSGLTATILALGLAIAGLPEGAVYDGSWTEWAGQDDTPVLPGRKL
ncbi:3-mercaptopyruvate sulfurtransferase [Denitratisoma sp. agr-D3]